MSSCLHVKFEHCSIALTTEQSFVNKCFIEKENTYQRLFAPQEKYYITAHCEIRKKFEYYYVIDLCSLNMIFSANVVRNKVGCVVLKLVLSFNILCFTHCKVVYTTLCTTF